MEFRVLGPVEIWVEGRPVEPGPPQQRGLLAALLADAGRVVTAETLIDRVWDEPPESARRSLHGLVARLRRVLERAGAGGAVVRRGGGYVVETDRVDVLRFRRLVEQARRPGCDVAQRCEVLAEALALWRGEPLSGLSGSWVERTRQAWSRQYLDALVAWARAELVAGEPARVVGRVGELMGEYPFAESLCEVLMRALQAAGRSAEAVEVFASFRRRLAEELGTDPGAELQAVHGRLLRGDPDPAEDPAANPALDPAADSAGDPAADPAAAGRRGGWVVPEQLPAAARYFFGRGAELDRLVRAARTPGTVVIAAVDGMAGVGKTSLAVLAAHRMAGAGLFPDGRLFIDLRGFSGGPPTEPAAALETLLRGLGVPGPQIPPGMDARSGLYRSVLARRRVLVVLDNAWQEAQVRPLLPGAGGSRVLVTSRRRLSGLDEAEHLGLDTLPAADATGLFRAVTGPDRDPGDDRTVEELVRLCGLLPLSVRIAAARLRTGRGPSPMTGADLLDLLRAESRDDRLAALTGGDRSVAAAFAVSYQHLPGDQQRAFALLGQHPGADYEPHAAAALLDSTPARTHHLLDDLERVNLLDQPTPGRYRFHDLIRAYAATADAGTDPTAALDRLYAHYAHTATVAMNLAHPYDAAHRPRPPQPATPTPDLPEEVAALAWLDAELTNLLPTAHHAVDRRPDHTTHQSATLRRHLRARGLYADAHALHERAVAAARATGDHDAELDALNGLGQIHRLQSRYGPAAECHGQALAAARGGRYRVDALLGLGSVHYLQGRHDAATDCYHRALAEGCAAGDEPGRIEALIGLGSIHHMQGRHDAAADYHSRALAAARASANRSGQISALNGLGLVHQVRGQYSPAGDRFREALEAARATGSRIAELIALNGLGRVLAAQGRYGPAADRYDQALAAARAAGDRNGQIAALIGLGEIHLELGRHTPAADCYREVLRLAGTLGSRNWQFEGNLGLGRTLLAGSHPERALTVQRRALALAGDLHQAPDVARAHDGLAHAHRALDHPDTARGHWQQALDILTALGTPVTDDLTAVGIRARLADLDTAVTGPARP